MKSTTNTAPLLPNNETLSESLLQIQKFFNGDSIEKIRIDLEQLRDTTITESYGELDKEDKWLLIEFLRRIAGLVEAAHLLTTK
ncbi:hypothetical protein [Pseudobacter ginsenosidimutans]|uniref:Uncharacterized protein n=1 Tax=Pseudobacter ginsenosidimutans TaxID=661488 RepID=A0A4Q7N3Q1_9BACT|nr:hypothetical protein [Pseudobacter ginsenosidimutans]QEC44153.1 hypothetical protein FSB84_21645 [Pseudobacter ginsenosidimutans]RZS75601.1 hypothetical protein EV199_1470 [Pseudobacter ginsenosidimutans]